MESIKALLCQQCGARLPKNLQCKYCETRYVQVGHPPEGQAAIAVRDGCACGLYECQCGIYDIYDIYPSGVWGEGPLLSTLQELFPFGPPWPRFE